MLFRSYAEEGALEGDGSGIALQSASTRAKAVAQPTIYSRAQWGADESIRDKSSLRYGTISAGFVHHTVNANDYTEDQVPAIIRSIYAYHVKSRGWSDIGYNFLVDRFGQIFEGRAGGVAEPIVGAQAVGWNSVSTGIAIIGTFEQTAPPEAALNAEIGRAHV